MNGFWLGLTAKPFQNSNKTVGFRIQAKFSTMEAFSLLLSLCVEFWWPAHGGYIKDDFFLFENKLFLPKSFWNLIDDTPKSTIAHNLDALLCANYVWKISRGWHLILPLLSMQLFFHYKNMSFEGDLYIEAIRVAMLLAILCQVQIWLRFCYTRRVSLTVTKFPWAD